jgi:hypothetical protein
MDDAVAANYASLLPDIPGIQGALDSIYSEYDDENDEVCVLSHYVRFYFSF